MNRLHVRLPLLAFLDPASVTAFYVINDGVMGGVSSSRVGYTDGSLVFEGQLSLEHNGGFASFRGPVTVPGEAIALIVRLRGDGKRYKLTLKPEDSNATWQYQSPFQSTGGWQTLRFEPGNFAARFRGRPVAAPPLDFGRMGALGVLISDRQAGPFRLEIRDVHAE